MATKVVSGRVDEDVKRRADAYIKKEGLTPADVIKIVWDTIAETGEIPQKTSRNGAERPDLNGFFEACDELPVSDEFESLTERQMKELLAGRYE